MKLRSAWNSRLVVLATALSCAFASALAQPLSVQQQDVLRKGRQPASGQPVQDAIRLAAKLGAANNYDAIPFLIELGDPFLFNNFTNAFTGPTTAQLAPIIVKNRNHPVLSVDVVRLVRDYQSTELFNVFLSDIANPVSMTTGTSPQANASNYLQIVCAITRTRLPDIEPELTAVLSRVVPHHRGCIAKFLVSRRYLPAEGALIDWLSLSSIGELRNVAPVVLGLGTQSALDAAVRRLVELRFLSPNAERYRHESLATLIEAIGFASPRAKLNRSLLTARTIEEFAPEHRSKIALMVKSRERFERMAEELTPDNFVYWASRPDALDELKSFIARGAAIDAADKSGNTPLAAATRHLNVQAVATLLERGANADVRGEYGLTPLQLLSRRNESPGAEALALEIAKLLVSKRAALSHADSNGMTALHLAADARFRPMVVFLVESGAEINAQATADGLTGLTSTLIASDRDDAGTETFLRSKGGTVNRGFVIRRAARRAAAMLLVPFAGAH
ncbi:ankyrin repeat domain-containing protein [Ramlibacter sp. WS9]|uniref:ankyrin repeat domain-containing protein n=1 Tax=Ramlibacter sp. WS9 TaxID=1882741 RepID=UPI00114508DE|nr:ankyrin repeat domain-containing protein [Ramlibacter sp. WS9]ROZ63150.1 ankyrin repeat domain-containing protein [Ramlibacter sp. WS9]